MNMEDFFHLTDLKEAGVYKLFFISKSNDIKDIDIILGDKELDDNDLIRLYQDRNRGLLVSVLRSGRFSCWYEYRQWHILYVNKTPLFQKVSKEFIDQVGLHNTEFKRYNFLVPSERNM